MRKKRHKKSVRSSAGISKPSTKSDLPLAGDGQITQENIPSEPIGAPESIPEVGNNLRKLRTSHGLSLEKLAISAGVSRAMLGQIELGQSTPTIKTLWKIARALDVPFSALISTSTGGETLLLRAEQTRQLSNQDGTFVSRALFPLGGPRRVEFYELRLAPHGEENAIPHPAGTVENLTVNQGMVEIDVRNETYQLKVGDVLSFEADVPHAYRNPYAQEVVMYLVMVYTQWLHS